jgi:acetaldehyde dehydrogenase (acetylating)
MTRTKVAVVGSGNIGTDRVGRRGLVGGQEDMIGDVALDLLGAAGSPQNHPLGGRNASRDGVTVAP